MKILQVTCFFILLLSQSVAAAVVRGKVMDPAGVAIPYANIYTKDGSFGASCDLDGSYSLRIPSGKYTLVFSAVGYEKHEEAVSLSKDEIQILNIQLKESSLSLDEAVVTATYVDRGKEIMRHVREKRDGYFDAVENYRCQTYQKISLEKIETDPSPKPDSTDTKKEKKRKKKKKEKPPTVTERASAGLSKLRKMKLIESVEEISYKKPGKYKIIVHAYNDFSDISTRFHLGNTVSIGFEYGEADIADVGHQYEDPYLIYFKPYETDFNFYRNLINAPQLCQKPLLSPLASTAELSYRFSLDTSFFNASGQKIYRIKVIPIFEGEALFSGIIQVADSTWAVQSMELSINPQALLFCHDFHISQQYAEVQPGAYLPVKREFSYNIKEGSLIRNGNTYIEHSNYEVNIEFPPRFFNNEIKAYDVMAFDKDSTWWSDLRPIAFRSPELKYIEETDSVRNYFESDVFLDSVDAEYNKLDIWNYLLTGIGHQSHRTGISYFINPLIAQINPFGIGGYRHRFGGSFSKEFENNYLLETNGFIDYGFNNHDVKGKIGAGLTYVPKKFVRTFIDVGDYYDVINTYASLSTVFSRSNYVRARTVSISQRMEIVNGLFGELSLEYASLDPLTDLQLDKWSEVIYGDLNEPTDFKSYLKSEVSVTLKYRPGQKYIIKGNKKIITGSKYPTFSMRYRKGINGLFNSEVNFDYIEAGINQELQLSRFGSGSWNLLSGTFFNKSSLRVIEYRYFRGSDQFLFSNPLNSFQLLGPTLSASGPFFRANGIFHDQGYLFNKIPVLNKAHLGLAGGAGALIIPEQDDFKHAEVFAGIEWIFRVKKQLFRAGFYGVTAANTVSLPELTWKFGFSFYNDYKKTWDY